MLERQIISMIDCAKLVAGVAGKQMEINRVAHIPNFAVIPR